MKYEKYKQFFSPYADRAVSIAVEECKRMKHARVGPEHLLLGLLLVGDSEASKLLTKHGVRLFQARFLVDTLPIRHTKYIPVEPELSSSANHVLYLAWLQSVTLGSPLVLTEHMLTAILKKDGNRNAVIVLKALGVRVPNLYADLMEVLVESTSGDKPMKWLIPPRPQAEKTEPES